MNPHDNLIKYGKLLHSIEEIKNKIIEKYKK